MHVTKLKAGSLSYQEKAEILQNSSNNLLQILRDNFMWLMKLVLRARNSLSFARKNI